MNIYQLSSKEGARDILVDDRKCKTDKDFLRLQCALQFEGKPLKRWKAPSLFSLYPRKPFADVTLPGISTGSLAVNPKGLDALEMFLEMAGELFPVQFADTDFTFCNITECVDCVDESRSESKVLASDGRRIWRKVHFDFSLLPESTLFKIPQWPTKIFCWERHNDPEGEFKACYEKHKLKGINFSLVQSGEK